MFNAFYQRIEEIQMAIIKIQPIVVESIEFSTKIERNTEDFTERKEDLCPTYDMSPAVASNEVESISSLAESMYIFILSGF